VYVDLLCGPSSMASVVQERCARVLRSAKLIHVRPVCRSDEVGVYYGKLAAQLEGLYEKIDKRASSTKA
jgi:hypothetical protein